MAYRLAQHAHDKGGSTRSPPTFTWKKVAATVRVGNKYRALSDDAVYDRIKELKLCGLLTSAREGMRRFYVWKGPLARPNCPGTHARTISQNLQQESPTDAISADFDCNTIDFELGFDSSSSDSETAFETAVEPGEVPPGWETGEPWHHIRARRARATLPCVSANEAHVLADAFDAELAALDAPEPAPPPVPDPPPPRVESKAVGLERPPEAKPEPEPAEEFDVVAAIERLARLAKEQEACPVYQAKQRAEAERRAKYERAVAEIDARQRQREAERAQTAKAARRAMPAAAGGQLGLVPSRTSQCQTAPIANAVIQQFLQRHAGHLGQVDARFFQQRNLTYDHLRWAVESVTSKAAKGRVTNPPGMVLSAALKYRDGVWAR